MKKLTLLQLIIVLLFVACYRNLAAQTPMKRPPPQGKQQDECYNKYYNAGIGHRNKAQYDLAIKQFEAAKYCPKLTAVESKKLDSIIVDTYNKLKKNSKKG